MLKLPPALQGIFFDFVWDKAKVWALSTPISEVETQSLEWHLALPVWSTVIGEPLFDLTPSAVLAQPGTYTAHWHRILQADLAYPLDLFPQNTIGRWVILDGYHRLARCILEGRCHIQARFHPEDALPEIRLR